MPICNRALIFSALMIGIALSARIDWIDRNAAIAAMSALVVFYVVRGRSRSCNIGG